MYPYRESWHVAFSKSPRHFTNFCKLAIRKRNLLKSLKAEVETNLIDVHAASAFPILSANSVSMCSCAALASVSLAPEGPRRRKPENRDSLLSQLLTLEPSDPVQRECFSHLDSLRVALLQPSVCHLTQPLKTASQLVRQNSTATTKGLGRSRPESTDIAKFQQKRNHKGCQSYATGYHLENSHLIYSIFWI